MSDLRETLAVAIRPCLEVFNPDKTSGIYLDRVSVRIAAEVLAELSTAHVLVEREEYADQHDELAEVVGAANRVVSEWLANDDFASFEQSIEELRRALVDWDLLGAYDLDPTASDTTETP